VGTRDWSRYPAVVRVDVSPTNLYAISDIHGGYERAVTLLTAAGLLAAAPHAPSAARWAAGSSVLVVAGDLMDKGPQSVEVIDLFMALENDAASQGGRVVVTLGNHEAEFLADPQNSKATGTGGVDVELHADGIAPATFASPSDPHGAWLRSRPFAALVGGWFFAHAGDTAGLSLPALEGRLEAAVNAHPDFDAPDIVGTSSILESRGWFADASSAPRNAAALGANHIVFGHDPQALGPRGAIAFDASHLLVRIDCGLSPLVNDSNGKLLRVRRVDAADVVEELDSTGRVTPLFTSAP
jgi:hypothetical protein